MQLLIDNDIQAVKLTPVNSELTLTMLNMKITTKRFFYLAVAGIVGTGLSPAFGQDDADTDEGEVFELSPFEVATEKDKGYYASNSISGSRISVPIQDIPLTIEVVTSEFIEDTGATNLRDSLKYSAGLLLQSQNDAYGTFDNFGGVNNPEGATGDKGDSSFKIRGFVLNNTLRNGFRRQHSTDSINIDRIEVVRGPSALLYGVGNFGGIVNYITKAPLPEFQQKVDVGYGSDGYKRATIDSTGPILDSLGYRINFAYEDRDDWTDLNTTEKWFVSPVVEWRPNDKIKLTVDYEYGRQDEDAISFKSVRAPTLEGIPIFQADRLETYGFLEFPDKDVRTYRWSGPDSFLDTNSWNASANLEVEISEAVFYRGGINKSNVKFYSRDVFGGIATNTSDQIGQKFQDTILAKQIIDGATNDVEIPVENAVLQYAWNGSDEETDWIQHRHELNWDFRLFEESRWLASDHNFLAGWSVEQQKFNRTGEGQEGFLFKNPTDSSYLRFGMPDQPADGSGQEDLEFEPQFLEGSRSENEGMYMVYSGRYLKDRLFLVAGYRQDTTSSLDGYYEEIGSRQGRIFFDNTKITQDTVQFGASVEIVNGLTVFALTSEGVEPNFGGKRDGLGRALEATVADATEFGFKVNLFDGKIAGTISKFKIERSGLPFEYWWAPAPVRGEFRRNEDIVYQLSGPTGPWVDRSRGAVADQLRIENNYLGAAAAEYTAAVAAGAIYEADTTIGGRDRAHTYVNASTPEGAAFLDKVFSALNEEFAKPRDERTDNDPWPGWLYDGFFDDPLVNSAGEDRADGDFSQSISDKSEGFEAQFIFTPNDNWQLIVNYSHVEREVVNPGNFVEYDYADGNWDRWTTWYFPNANWGLAGFDPTVVYPGGSGGLPSQNTSDWSGIGWGKGESLDDTPEDVISFWGRYEFSSDHRLAGLEMGLGGIWESSREYASAFTSAGQRKQNETPTSIKAATDPRLTLNCMARYSFTLRENIDAYFQVNVDNFLDDDDQYGLVYAPGRSWKIHFGMTF
jgi:outer membrane receptor protein involved in Fe transport